jgi:hypothetical protein
VIGASRIVGAAGQTRVVGTGAACAGDALLRVGTGRIEAGHETLSVDADTRVATLEVELASERRRVGVIFERIETKAVVRAGGPDRAFVVFLALAYTAERGA